MPRVNLGQMARMAIMLSVFVVGFSCGCKAVMEAFSQRLTHWTMLDEAALNDPIATVESESLVFRPADSVAPMTRAQLARATPEILIRYYAPLFVQQRVDSGKQRPPDSPEYDTIGQAQLKRENGKLKPFVAGEPKVYTLLQRLPLEGREHLQITYTAWYPAHPRWEGLDVEAADVESCVLRLTLDDDHAPLFYETIAAGGRFHKVFVQSWIESAARTAYGPPESGKKFCVERVVREALDWEVAGTVDEPRDQPRQPILFLKAGDHRVLGMGSAARLKLPRAALQRTYDLVSHAELDSVPIQGSAERSAFLDLVQVDQANWNDPSIYTKYLRLPPEAFGPAQR